jgi:hypothetical protein
VVESDHSISMRCRVTKRSLLVSALLFPAAIILFSAVFSSRVPPPMHNGKPLTYWAKQHPSKYYEAVRALGTNALPYLLAELDARDAAPARLLQRVISRVISMGEVFTHAKHRRYYARLGLQQLDTNAVPALLGLFVNNPSNRFTPISNENFDVAWALSWTTSREAETMKLATFTNLLASADLSEKILACNGFSYTLSGLPPENVTSAIFELAGHPDPRLRQAAIIFFSHHSTDREREVPLLVKAVSDPNEAVGRFALNALQFRDTDFSSIVPGLLTTYSNMAPSQLRNEVGQALRRMEPTLRLP